MDSTFIANFCGDPRTQPLKDRLARARAVEAGYNGGGLTAERRRSRLPRFRAELLHRKGLRYNQACGAVILVPSTTNPRDHSARGADGVQFVDPSQIALQMACSAHTNFSSSFTQAFDVGLQCYVIQRRIERTKTFVLRTIPPLALIAQEVRFADQSHPTSIFRREMRTPPGRNRATLA